MAYLDRKLGDSKLTPNTVDGYATMLMWASVGIDYGYGCLVSPLHADELNTEVITQAAEQLKLLDAGLGTQNFLCGSSLSLADLLLFPMVRFALTKIGDTKPNGLKALTTWNSRISARASVRRLEKVG
jgi:glutathione S-transferase